MNVIQEYPAFIDKVTTGQYFPENVPVKVMHAAIGIVTEAGEFIDQLKKAYAYGKDIDYTNLDEEIGDMLWYIQLYANQRGKTLDSFVEQNIAKLTARYGDSWTKEAALNRDLNNEREVLEQHDKG